MACRCEYTRGKSESVSPSQGPSYATLVRFRIANALDAFHGEQSFEPRDTEDPFHLASGADDELDSFTERRAFLADRHQRVEERRVEVTHSLKVNRYGRVWEAPQDLSDLLGIRNVDFAVQRDQNGSVAPKL